MDTIVIAYDDSDVAKRALERASTLAGKFGSKLVVTSVAPVTTPASGRSVGADPTDTGAEHDAQLGAAKAYLETQGQQADYIEALGHPGDAIIAAAEDRKADLIVIGTRELGTIQRILGQSVSDSVSHHAHCDVLLVH